MEKTIIEFQDVRYTYENHEPVLEGISFKINQGETVAIVGANGAGKSTLMKLMTGILKPDQGQVSIDGMKVEKHLKAIRKKVGYTFQDPDNQLFMPSVYEDVAFGPKQEGKSKEEVDQIVSKSLTAVGGLHLADKASYNMSGGEKRVVTIATALASEPEILILDEPSVGLDPRSRRQLIHLLASRNETKIIATHDMDLALELCTRVIVLYKGAIQGDAAPMVIFNNRDLLCDNHLELPLQLQGCPICSLR